MISEIYYFSGTGNSLAAARMINEGLAEKGRIVSIPSADGKQAIQADRVGFVFPVYCHKAPGIVKRFIENADFVSSPYIYAVATHAGEPGQSLFEIQEILAGKGQSLSFGSAIAMPGNAVKINPDIEEERLSGLGRKAREIAGLIESVEKGAIDGDNGFMEHIRNRIVGFAAWNFIFDPKLFRVSDECSGCGTCEKLCPVNNIHMAADRPEWGKDCTGCLACFHWCPKEAIYMNNSVIGRRRKYHHPDITACDMLDGNNCFG